MRFAAIADIHGNKLALEAVIADIGSMGIRDIVNLGDHLSGPLVPPGTADVLMESQILSIQGDQDRILVDLSHSSPALSDRNDFKQLSRRHFDWLASLPSTMLYRDEVFLCHGTPKDDATHWLEVVSDAGRLQKRPIEQVASYATGVKASLLLCGHTHLPEIACLPSGQIVVNVGSVGCPGYEVKKPVAYKVEAGTPHACYAIFEKTRQNWTVTFRYVPYDHAAMAKMAEANGLRAWASALRTGRIS
jgi:predicted phosphodiesterase